MLTPVNEMLGMVVLVSRCAELVISIERTTQSPQPVDLSEWN
jgi:hypothetical protein